MLNDILSFVEYILFYILYLVFRYNFSISYIYDFLLNVLLLASILNGIKCERKDLTILKKLLGLLYDPVKALVNHKGFYFCICCIYHTGMKMLNWLGITISLIFSRALYSELEIPIKIIMKFILSKLSGPIIYLLTLMKNEIE